MFRLRNMQLGSAALATGWQRFRWKSSWQTCVSSAMLTHLFCGKRAQQSGVANTRL
jgi:hypothetical protein